METATIDKVEPGTYTLKEVLGLRKSCRGFLEMPVPNNIITSVLEDAQLAPSNCNTQPWETHIVSGDKLKELSHALIRENNAGRFSPDFTFDTNEYYADHKERYYNLAETMYGGFYVARENKEGRKAAAD